MFRKIFNTFCEVKSTSESSKRSIRCKMIKQSMTDLNNISTCKRKGDKEDKRKGLKSEEIMKQYTIETEKFYMSEGNREL